jgi:hypothetical protein
MVSTVREGCGAYSGCCGARSGRTPRTREGAPRASDGTAHAPAASKRRIETAAITAAASPLLRMLKLRISEAKEKSERIRIVLKAEKENTKQKE